MDQKSFCSEFCPDGKNFLYSSESLHRILNLLNDVDYRFLCHLYRKPLESLY